MADRADCKRLRSFRQPQETTPGRTDSAAILLESKEKANRYWTPGHPEIPRFALRVEPRRD